MPWARLQACFEIPVAHWMEDLTVRSEALYDYFEKADLPSGWDFMHVIPDHNTEDLLIFEIDHMPSQEEYARVEQFILFAE